MWIRSFLFKLRDAELLIDYTFDLTDYTVHGMEYGFGAHEHPSSGVFEVEPKRCPGFIYRRSVWLGTTDNSLTKFREFIEQLSTKYHGNTYHLISKNCNHFTNDVCINLTGKPIPGWVNRLARLGGDIIRDSQPTPDLICYLYFFVYLSIKTCRCFRFFLQLSSAREYSGYCC